MYCSSCCGDVSSEIVPVTVNTTNLYVDDLPAIHRTETFEYADDSLNHKNFSLEYYPYEGKSVEVFRNGVAQRFGTDFTVQNGYVVLTIPLVDSNDSIYVRYWHVDGVTQTAGAVGTIVDSAGTLPLSGYLYMDGTTSQSWATYTQLHDWFYDSTVVGDTTLGAQRRAALLVSSTATHFVLKSLTSVTYQNDELVTLNKFISYGG